MDTLPAWLQWAVSIATVLSSIGVIVAFIQLRISGDQFNKQLKLTENQFKLLNQGYISLKLNEVLYELNEKNQLVAANQVTDYGIYYASALSANLKNVGNMPIRLDMKHCIVSANDKELYRTPEQIFKQAQITIYPSAEMPYNFGLFMLNEAQTGLSLGQVYGMNLKFDLLIEYSDFNDHRHIKKIDIGAALEGGQIIIKRNKDVI